MELLYFTKGKFFKLYFIALQKRFEKKKIKQQQQKQRLMAPIITGESKTLKKKETLLNAIVCGEGCETIWTCFLLLLASKLISPLAVPQRVFFMLVTLGSVWAKKKKKNYRVFSRQHTEPPPATKTHILPTTAPELGWRTKRQIRRSNDSWFLPKCPKPCPLFSCSWRSWCTITKKKKKSLWCYLKYH